MTCSAVSCDSSCVGFKHSGGEGNCDPCEDLGGEISDCDIITSTDNLFHSIGPKLSRRGHEDYRCFYIQNTETDLSLKNVKIYLDGPAKNHGTYVAIGVKLQNEIQEVIVNGIAPPNQGEYFTLQVSDYSPTFKVFYDANITKWVGNFQTAIRAVSGLNGVIVTATGIVPNVTFTINFTGQAINHEIDTITIIDNNLLSCTVMATPTQQGSPVNTTAEIIPDEITTPSGITFNYYFRGNPICVGQLRAKEYLPIWVRRTLPIVDPYYGPLARSGQMAKLQDKFQITVEATSP